jgi:hypothetical protein
MPDDCFNAKFVPQVPGQLIGRIHASVLAVQPKLTINLLKLR